MPKAEEKKKREKKKKASSFKIRPNRGVKERTIQVISIELASK